MARTEEVIELARTWLGTPYHHQASLKGVGADCVGLVRGVYRELYGVEPNVPLNYSHDWGDANGNEDLVKAGFSYLTPVETRKPGDVVLIRWKSYSVAKHCMILTEPGRAIHAYNRAPVMEIRLSQWWLDKIVYSFEFPEEVN